jgi:hypothetical protein
VENPSLQVDLSCEVVRKHYPLRDEKDKLMEVLTDPREHFRELVILKITPVSERLNN